MMVNRVSEIDFFIVFYSKIFHYFLTRKFLLLINLLRLLIYRELIYPFLNSSFWGYKMPEKQVKRFEKAMKKGFMSLLVLSVLEKKPRHGYGIMKDIKDLTLGLWEPPSSTIYTILDDLSENNLIQVVEEKMKEKRTRKLYDLTPKGEETLKALVKKQREMMNGMRSIIVSTLGIDEDEFPSEDIEKFINPSLMFSKIKPKTEEQKRNLLEKRKRFLKMRIRRLKQLLQNVEKQLENLQKNE